MAKSDAAQREGGENNALKTPTDLSHKGVGEILQHATSIAG